jgi:hypothetical protein
MADGVQGVKSDTACGVPYYAGRSGPSNSGMFEDKQRALSGLTNIALW